jgi:hypothetical protein
LKDGSDSPKTDGVEVDMIDTVRNPSAFGIFYRLVCQLIKSLDGTHFDVAQVDETGFSVPGEMIRVKNYKRDRTHAIRTDLKQMEFV